MPELPLVDAIIQYTKENNAPFSMPGHKSGRGFLETTEGKNLYDNFIKGDITEVEGLDNLHHPEGVIAEAQKLLSEFYGSKKSYFLVNGSSSGNLAMIFSSFNEGDKVIIERNCHRSVLNGVILRKLRPVYVKNKFNNIYNAPISVNKEHFLQVVNENKDAKGIIVTYPNYYGVCVNLKFIIKEAEKYNMKVLVDSAHGAHFGVCEGLPESAVRLGAHMVVMSAHKTLPSLTQTAYLHVSDKADIDRVDFYVSSLLSTSPSYMLMASMDYARFYLDKYGKETFESLLSTANNYRKKINDIGFFHVISKKELIENNLSGLSNDIYDLDESRYIINIPKGYSGEKLLMYLRDEGIQAEMSDESNVVLIFSPFNHEEDFEKLYQVLCKCNIEKIKNEIGSSEIIICDLPNIKLLPYEVLLKEKKSVKFEMSEGLICAEAVVPYPPGIPIIMPGEVYSDEVIKAIKYYDKNKSVVLGVKNGCVKFV
ncbi:MAG: aminotransferase class I/II-fold pyridoxal phosphate-dependent enzyme [Bacillota bacterium]|nr:aminotransferase class I/II-fold pyridoxal phosphate-dependent enzyme [Bacillota bacterium]